MSWPSKVALIVPIGGLFGLILGAAFAGLEAGLLFLIWGRSRTEPIAETDEKQASCKSWFWALPPAAQQTLAWALAAACLAAYMTYHAFYQTGQIGIYREPPYFFVTVAPAWLICAVVIGRSHYQMARPKVSVPTAAAWCVAWTIIGMALFAPTFLYLAICAHSVAGGHL